MVVAVVSGGQQRADGAGYRSPAGDRERAAFAEVILHVNDDERAHGVTLRGGCPLHPRNGGLRPPLPLREAAAGLTSLRRWRRRPWGWPGSRGTAAWRRKAARRAPPGAASVPRPAARARRSSRRG